MRLMLLGMIAVMLGGCVTDYDVAYLASNYYTRAEINAIATEVQCKQLARNLVQMARCEVRR